MTNIEDDAGSEPWVELCTEADLAPGRLRTFKVEGHQLAVGRTEGGRPFAVDNRCPHEGYPLAQGVLKGGVLTCAWHNWKFDACSGVCQIGGENVRAYGVRTVRGKVQVDLTKPDPKASWASWLESFGEGVRQNDTSRALRDAVRLLESGYPAGRLAADLARDDARRGEYGTTHVLPVAADCARLFHRYSGGRAIFPLAPVIDLCGESNARLPVRTLPPVLSGASLEVVRRAVESEDAERAEGFVRGALVDGVSWNVVLSWLATCAADHFLDFGHALIYVVKAAEVLEEGDSEHAEDILGALTYGIVMGTREDTLPYLRDYFRPSVAAVSADSPSNLLESFLDGKRSRVVADFHAAFLRGVSEKELAEELVIAGAERLLRFDARLEDDPDVAENWLWVTHRFTFASAVRQAVARYGKDLGRRLLLQAVAFVHSGAPMDAPLPRRHVVTPVPSDVPGVLRAIMEKDPEAAMNRAAGYLASGASASLLREKLEDLCLEDPPVRPIFAAHAIKTLCAAFDEYEVLAHREDRSTIPLAAIRFLASPLRESRVHHQAKASLAWIAEGRMPKKLTQS